MLKVARNRHVHKMLIVSGEGKHKPQYKGSPESHRFPYKSGTLAEAVPYICDKT